jgi:hypothetical protein
LPRIGAENAMADSLDVTNGPLVAHKRGRPVVGHFQNYVHLLPRLVWCHELASPHEPLLAMVTVPIAESASAYCHHLQTGNEIVLCGGIGKRICQSYLWALALFKTRVPMKGHRTDEESGHTHRTCHFNPR